MIVEFALTLTLSLPQPAPNMVKIEFSEPVQQVVTYPQVGVLNQISGLTLPEGTREVFEQDFLEGSVFFGAFAITKEFGYGYVTGTNSIEAAREIALEECYKQAPRCLLYAEIMPEGYAPLETGQISLAPEAAAHFNDPDPSRGSFRAMAISEDGAYSVVWNHANASDAAAAALSDCSEYLVSNLPDLRAMPCMLIPFK